MPERLLLQIVVDLRAYPLLLLTRKRQQAEHVLELDPRGLLRVCSAQTGFVMDSTLTCFISVSPPFSFHLRVPVAPPRCSHDPRACGPPERET